MKNAGRLIVAGAALGLVAWAVYRGNQGAAIDTADGEAVGYLAGLVKPENGRLRSATGPMAVVVAAAVGTTLLYAGVGALVGDTAARHVGLGSLLFTAALYDLLLAPFVVPGIMALARRAENDPLAEAGSTAKSADISSGWLSSGTGLRIGGQRGGLGSLKTKARTRTARVGRIKGVKRL